MKKKYKILHNIISPFSSLNSQFLPLRGFTLIELLTSIAIFAVIGTIGISLLTFTLRGGKKTDAMENIRQQGDVVLTTLVRTIRHARHIDAPVCTGTVTAQELTVSPIAADPTTISCTDIPNAIAVDGVSLIDTNTIVVQNCSFTCRQPAGAENPTVTIQFTLSSKDSTGLFENKVSIPFQTSVSTRNALQ